MRPTLFSTTSMNGSAFTGSTVKAGGFPPGPTNRATGTDGRARIGDEQQAGRDRQHPLCVTAQLRPDGDGLLRFLVRLNWLLDRDRLRLRLPETEIVAAESFDTFFR